MNSVMMSEREALAYRPGAGAPVVPLRTQPQGFDFCSINAVTFASAASEVIPAPDFILGPLQPGDLGILSGADGSGKSIVALEMAATVAHGIDIAGVVDVPARRGRVLYIAGEDRESDHARRMQALREHVLQEHSIDIAQDDCDSFTLWPLLGRRCALTARLPGGGYTVTETGRQFEEIIAGFRLVVIDPLRMFHDMEEKDGPGMDCWRRFKIEPPCRLNFEPGLLANL